MNTALNGIWAVIPDDVSSEEKNRIEDAVKAKDERTLADMGYTLCQMGDYGKVWLGPDFGTNFDFLHWWWDQKYNQEAKTHGNLAEISGLTEADMPRLHSGFDARFTGSYYPTEEDLQKLAKFYQIPKEGLKGKTQTQEQMVKSRKNL